jgi:hypothetical protein
MSPNPNPNPNLTPNLPEPNATERFCTERDRPRSHFRVFGVFRGGCQNRTKQNDFTHRSVLEHAVPTTYDDNVTSRSVLECGDASPPFAIATERNRTHPNQFVGDEVTRLYSKPERAATPFPLPRGEGLRVRDRLVLRFLGVLLFHAASRHRAFVVQSCQSGRTPNATERIRTNL